MKKYDSGADKKFGMPEMPSQMILPTVDAGYLYRFERTMALLEQALHFHDEPEEIALDTMEVARDFYDADWCGLISCDFNAGIFYPYWWTNRSEGKMADTKFEEFEFVHNYDNWVNALLKGKPIILDDLEKRKNEITQSEYQHYLRLEVHSAIGIPLFYHLPCGFIVVKNPGHYLEHPEMLAILGYVVLNCWKEAQNLEALKIQMKQSCTELKTEKDVYLKLFGEPELHTLKGQLSASTLNSPKGWRLLCYLALHNRPTPIRTIAEALGQEDDIDHAVNSMRVTMSRLKPKLESVLDPAHAFITSTDYGYRIDPYYHVITDADEFEKTLKSAEAQKSIHPRIAEYKKAVELYRGPLYKEASSEHWILSTVEHYAVKYVKAVNHLLRDLAELKDYMEIQRYASRALELEPTNVDFEYWLIIALEMIGTHSSAKAEFSRAEHNICNPAAVEKLRSRLQAFEYGHAEGQK